MITLQPVEIENSTVVDLQSEFNVFPTSSPFKKYTISFNQLHLLHNSLSSADAETCVNTDDLLNQIKEIYTSDQQQNVDYLIHCLRVQSALGPAIPDILHFISCEILSVLREKPDVMSLYLLRLIQCIDAIMHNEEYSNERFVPFFSCFHF